MISYENIHRVVWIAVAVALLFCIGAMILAPKLLKDADLGVKMEYETRIFDTSKPVVIDIQMDADQWDTMLKNATQEIYYQCDLVIDGTKFYGVGIRPKGNTSLSSIAMNSRTNRFSFKVEFDQFVDGQTAWGLDKLCLNNNYADATNMKEALVYDMYEFLGADASLYNYAEIYVNGEYWGVYLALEAVEDSFMLRNYGVSNGALYKPDSMGMDRGDDEGFGPSDGDRSEGEDFGPSDGDRPEGEDFGPSGGDRAEGEDEGRGGSGRQASGEPEAATEPAAEPDPMPPEGELSDTMKTVINEFEAKKAEEEAASDESADGASGDASGEASGEGSRDWNNGEDEGWDESDGGPFGGGPFGGGGGQNLNYLGDDLDSYSTIWRSEVTKTTEADHRRVVEALKNISESENLEESMFIDNLLRMMAVHNFSVNGDSLSGGMAHNYYLYESGGRLNVVPWDYNLAFGGMGMGGNDARSVVNEPIDDSWQSTSFFDPLLENEEYLAKYHEYYRQLVEEYIFGGRFDEFYEHTRAQIDDLVATDPNALYSYEEFDAAAETLHQLVDLRGESIEGQLNGTIPSTSSGQRQDSSALVAAENLDLSLMGSMSMGGDFGGGGGWGEGGNPFRNRNASGERNSASGEAGGDSSGEAGDGSSGEAGDGSSGEQSGESPGEAESEGSASAEMQTARTGPEDPESGEAETAGETEAAEQPPEEPASAAEAGEAGEASGEAGEESGRRFRGGSSGEMDRGLSGASIGLLIACGVVLIGGLAAAILIKKKR